MKTVKVSVLTPIYNHDVKYVRKCLDSLKAQTIQDRPVIPNGLKLS